MPMVRPFRRSGRRLTGSISSHFPLLFPACFLAWIPRACFSRVFCSLSFAVCCLFLSSIPLSPQDAEEARIDAQLAEVTAKIEQRS